MLRSCKDVKDQGFTINAVYDLQHDNGATFKAYCDMKTNNGGWTVLQRRINASVSFDRNWAEYVMGFGNPSGNHWLGLEAMHQLTKKGDVTLRFDLKHRDGSAGYAEYDKFKIAAASENYKIHFNRYKGNVGDSLTPSNGQPFTTKDKDNDKSHHNCAVYFKGAWWHLNCFQVNLNSFYPGSQPSTAHGPLLSDTMSWRTWKGAYGGIVFSEMKLRRES